MKTVVKSVWPSARMNRFLPKDQDGILQLISVDEKFQSSTDLSVIVKNILKLGCAHTCLCSLRYKKRDLGTCLTWSCLCVLW